MADQSDVETRLVALTADAVYPQGSDSGSACVQECRIYRGWPNPAALDADLSTGLVHITVTPVDGSIRNTTRYPDTWQWEPPAPTLWVSCAANVVTFGGTADPGQLAGLAADGRTYVHKTQEKDTPELVAAYLASQARADFVVQLSGGSITVLGAANVTGRVVSDAASSLEVRRQTQRFRIAFWCNDPAVRDRAVSTVDSALAQSRFMDLADASKARLTFAGGLTLDRSENASLYRRDLLYDVEYATSVTAIRPAMLFGTTTMNGKAAVN